MNYYDIHPISGYVRTEQIKEDSSQPLTACTIIGISIYPNECITAIIKLEGGEVFSYIPFHSLCSRKNGSEDVKTLFASHDVETTHFFNAPSCNVEISYMQNLRSHIVYTIKNIVKGKDLPITDRDWVKGQYLFTIDFVDDNELVNLIELDNGLFLLRPFHKIKFLEATQIQSNELNLSLEGYKKQRNTYKIDYKK